MSCTCMTEDGVVATPSGSCPDHAWQAEVVSGRVPPRLRAAAEAINEALATFEWAGHDPSFSIDEDADGRVRLSMRIWVADNDDEESECKPLTVSQDVVEDESAEEQIRSLIHGYLTHEADEQLVFKGRRPFYPH